MPKALRKRLRLNPEDVLPPTEFELTSATDAMSAFEQICLSIPASGALIAVRDAGGLHCVGSLGDAPEVGSRIPTDFGMALECLETGAAGFTEFPDDAQRILRVGMTMEGVSQIRSAAVLPMRAAKTVVGLIAVFSQRESSIQSRDVKALGRIADFWGPVMADEWFPDGIPVAIAGNSATSVSTAELPSVVEETLLAEARSLSETNPTLKESNDKSEEVAATEPAEAEPETLVPARAPAGAAPETHAQPAVAPSAANSEPPLATEPIEREEPLPSVEPSEAEPVSASEAALSTEAGVIARAAMKPESPVFLAPAEPIPVEAFHSGEPNRFIWIIVLAVFLVVLLPLWLLKSHSNKSFVTSRNAVSASNTMPTAANSANANTAITATASPDPSTKSRNKTTTTSPGSRTLSPDSEIPKPLPDLNSLPDPENATKAPPKPELPAFLNRILKSPNVTSTKSVSDPSAPPAPDITGTSGASPPSLSATTESSGARNSPGEAPEPAQPINPAPAGFQPPNFALAQTLKAHSGWVSSLAFSPNGTLASGSWDRTVKFWDLATGREVHALSDKLKQVQALAFSRDGKLLAVEDTSDTVTIFDASTGALLRELPTDKTVPSVGISWVYSIAFSPDGRWLASAVDDKTVRIWDVATGTKIRDLSGPRRPVVYVAFSPNGELVATGNDDKSIQIWNVASGAPTTTLAGHKKVINAVAFTPDGKFLASASGDKTIRLWDVATGEKIRTLSGHQAAVSSISFSADGRWLASGSWDKTVRIWNRANGKEVQVLRPDARAIYSVNIDPHGRWLAAGSEDGGVEIWQWNGAATSSTPASGNPETRP